MPLDLAARLVHKHLLVLQRDLPPGGHAEEAHELRAAGELKAAVSQVLAQSHVFSCVCLVLGTGLLPGVLFPRVPETNHGQEAQLTASPCLFGVAGLLVDGSLHAMLQDFKVLGQLRWRIVPGGLEGHLAVIQADGLDVQHVLHHLGGIVATAGVRPVVHRPCVHKDEVHVWKVLWLERLRLVQRAEDGQATVSLDQRVHPTTLDIQAVEDVALVLGEQLFCFDHPRVLLLQQQVLDVQRAAGLEGPPGKLQLVLQDVLLLLRDVPRRQLPLEVLGAAVEPP